MKKQINAIRVVIPVNAREKLELAQRIADKHNDLGAQSPLAALSWATQAPQIADALKLHKDAEEHRRKMEELYKKRDAIMEPIDDLIRQSRDMLKAVYRSEPFKMGEFGFNINSTATSAKKEATV